MSKENGLQQGEPGQNAPIVDLNDVREQQEIRARELPVIAVSGLHRGDNPQPGPAVIHSIRRRYSSAKIIGLSYDPLESGLFSAGPDGVDAAFSLPFPGVGAKALIERIDEICQTHPIGMIIPCLDSEIPNYFMLSKELRRRKIRITLPTPQSFDRRSKASLGNLGPEANILVPRTIVVADLASAYEAGNQIGYPLFIKGKLYDARRVLSAVEMAGAFYDVTSVWGGPAMVQQSIQGEEYDVGGLGDGKGNLVGSCSIRKMLLTKAGKAFAGVVVSDPVLDAHVSRIVSALRWNGPFELEFIKSADGYVLIEMNPRFPAWIDFPSQIGCNLPAALVERTMMRTASSVSACEPGRMFVRHCVDLVGDVSEFAEMCVTGTVMRGSSVVRMEVAE